MQSMLFMSGKHNEGEHGMHPTSVLYDDDQVSSWAVAVDEKGATDAMVEYGFGTIEQSGYIWGQDHFQIGSGVKYCKVEELHCGCEGR